MPPHSALLSQLYRLTSPPPGDAELLRRWVERRDEDAFTALVSRHGRMVHGVCRRVLGNSHDAEDAFQAVFLTLARKAAALRYPEALPGWLHGVAVRLARKARAAASRRRPGVADASAAEPADPHPDPLDALSARELLRLIDQEIARLLEAYRLPVVLCDLEERTQAEAARLLGWTLGSFRGRLLRGRERLRARLAKRGIAPAVLTAAFVQGTADAAALTAGVSQLAVRFAACPMSAEISPSVAALVREGIGGMMLTKLKLASAVLLAASTLVAGAGMMVWPTPKPQPAEERAEDKPPPAPVSAKPQVRRDQAGDPLPAEAISRLGTIRFRHGDMIECLAYGSDGKTLVSCGPDRLRFWDVVTGKEIHRFPEPSRAQTLALSPDGKLLAIRNANNQKDETIAIREFASGRLLHRFGDMRSPSNLRFSPDGKVLAAFSWQNDIELWDPATGRRLHTLGGHKDIVWSIAFSADGRILVSGSDDKTIRFWDVVAGKELRQIQHNQGIGKIALSPDGKLLATIDTIKGSFQGGATWHNDCQVRLWDTATGKELRQLAMPVKELAPKIRAGFSSLGFAPDGKTLLAGGQDGMLRIWDAATGKELRQISGFTGSPRTFTFAPDGKTMAVADDPSSIRVLDFASGKDVVLTPGHRSSVSSISTMPDGRTVRTMGHDGTVRFWEPATGRELRRRAVTVDYYRIPQLQADGRTYLTVGTDRMFRVHDLATGEELSVLRGHDARFSFALSPDGKMLASESADKSVRLLDPATGEVRHTLTKVKHWVTGMSFTADGRTLIVWDADRIVTIWEAATGKKRLEFTVPRNEGPVPPNDNSLSTYMATLSPDGKLLAFGLQSNFTQQPDILRIVETATGKEIRRFTAASEAGVLTLTFSPDGKSLAWGGGRDGTAYLGEIASGCVRRRFAGHAGRINSLAFSADGKMLISGSNDTTALVWDLTGRLAMGKNFGKALSATELETHWQALADNDAAAAFRAMQALAADPVRSVPYLRKRLHAVAPVDEKRLQQWIADLDSDQFSVREKATSELKKAGAAALHAMRKALAEKPSLETRRRLEQLIEKQEREEWSLSAEGLRSRRALEVLERAGTPEAKDVLTILANGAAGAWQTLDAKAALKRLAHPK